MRTEPTSPMRPFAVVCALLCTLRGDPQACFSLEELVEPDVLDEWRRTGAVDRWATTLQCFAPLEMVSPRVAGYAEVDLVLAGEERLNPVRLYPTATVVMRWREDGIPPDWWVTAIRGQRDAN